MFIFFLHIFFFYKFFFTNFFTHFFFLHFLVCFSIFQSDEKAQLDKGVVFNIFNALTKIYKENSTNVDEYVLKLFENSERLQQTTIDLQTIIKFSFENDFFVQFFSINESEEEDEKEKEIIEENKTN